MNISLTPDLTRMIQDKVASGQYRSASEVVREALRRLDERARPRAERIAQLRRKITEGMASSKAGRVIDGETGIKLIQARLMRLEKARHSRKPATG